MADSSDTVWMGKEEGGPELLVGSVPLPSSLQLPAPPRLVTLHGLASEKGKLLNGRHGFVLGEKNERLQLYLYSNQAGDKVELPLQGASAKPENCLERDTKCVVYQEFMGGSGMQLLQQGQYEEAKETFLTLCATRERPDANTVFQLAVILREMGELEQSVSLFQLLLPLQPEDSSQRAIVMYDLAAALTRSGKLEEAVEVALGIPTSNSYGAEIKPELLKIMDGALQRKLPATAVLRERVSRELVQLMPGDPIPVWNLGASLCLVGRLAEGVAEYERALGMEGLNVSQKKKLQKSLDLGRRQLEGEFGEEKVVSQLPDGKVVTLSKDSKAEYGNTPEGECFIKGENVEEEMRVHPEAPPQQ